MRLHDSNPAPHDTAEEHPLRHWLIVLVFACGLAFVLRLFYVESIQGIGFFRQPLSDAAVFDERAREIASGDLRGGADFVHAPLYAYFLGAVYAFLGSDPWIVRLVQAILGAASCLVLYAATRRLFDNRTALLAAILLAVYPPAIFFDGIIQKACLSLFLSTLLLLLLVQARDTDRLRRWALVGLAACFLILTRQSALVLLPLLALAAILRPRFESAVNPLDDETGGRTSRSVTRSKTVRGLLSALIVLAFTALALAPWVARNRQVTGEWVLTTPNLGQNFAMGNHPEATGTYLPYKRGRSNALHEQREWTRTAEAETGRHLSATEVSKYYLRASLAWIRENPGDWFRLLGRKWLMTWHAYEPYDTEDYYLYQQHSSLLASLDRVFHFGVLAPLSAAGLFLTWSDRRRLWPLYAWLLLIAAATALFVVFARYRAPMLPLLILFAAAGLVRGFDAFRERRTGRLGVAVLVLGVAGLASNAPGVHPRRPDVTSYLNHGAALAAQGRYQDDLAETAKAAEIDPDSVDVHLAAGNTLVQMGLYQEALNHYAKARDTEPDYAGAYRGVGDSLVGLNRPDLAAEQYRKALKLDSDDLAARNGLATALAQQGRLEEAVKLFAEVLKEDPDYVEALLNLGNTYASTGRLDEAAEAYERALSRSPEYVDALHNLGVIELHRGDAERAAGVLTKANKLAPDREDVRQALEAAKQLQEVKNAGSQ